MRHNHSIDFFSSPTSKFIGFSDIRQPYQDIHNHQQEPDQQKAFIRKSSFHYHQYEPIKSMYKDFFDEQLQQCEEPSNSDQNNNKDHYRQQPQIHHNKQQIFFQDDEIQINQHLSNLNPRLIQNNKHQQHQQKINEELQFTTPKKKSQFVNNKKFYQSTHEKQKTIPRNNQKGLRRLSSLAYQIVSESSATSYKQVAQKLLSRLNYDYHDMMDEQQSRTQKSSMQNIKRRVYDSLNVLIALGVIKRVGNKIARQKQKKQFFSTPSLQDTQKYNQIVNQCQKRLNNIKNKKMVQRQLRQKIRIFRMTIQRNKKLKNQQKNQIIRIPFVAFAINQPNFIENKSPNSCTLYNNQTLKIQWLNKKQPHSTLSFMEQKKPQINSKRHNNNMILCQNQRKKDQIVQIYFKGNPESFGDLDFFKLINQYSTDEEKQVQGSQFWRGNINSDLQKPRNQNSKRQQMQSQREFDQYSQINQDNYYDQQYSEQLSNRQRQQSDHKNNHSVHHYDVNNDMNLIDEVFEHL